MRLAWCVARGTRPRPAAAWVMKPKAEILPTMSVSTGSAKTRKERADTRDAARACGDIGRDREIQGDIGVVQGGMTRDAARAWGDVGEI